jgi:hypothetical protein
MHDLGVLVPIFALMIPIMAIWTKHQRQLAEMGIKSTAQESAEKAAQYATRIAEMEDRIRVLERIVTDGGYNVASQIEALRDTRRVEERLEDQRETSRN